MKTNGEPGPQFQLGATSSEAEMASRVASVPLPGPGAIVERLGHQFQLPRSSPDAEISRERGTPYG